MSRGVIASPRRCLVWPAAFAFVADMLLLYTLLPRRDPVHEAIRTYDLRYCGSI